MHAGGKIPARAERGASLSMALMLLLVCTMVASVVTAAASAAAGRQSELQKNDKSYYNVTSAANLIWDLLSDPATNTVIIKRTVPATRGADEWVLDRNNTKIWVNDSFGVNTDLRSANATLLEIASFDMVFNKSGDLTANRKVSATKAGDTIDSSGADPTPRPLSFGTLTYTFDLTPDVDIAGDFPPVSVTLTCEQGGTCAFEFAEKTDPSCVCTLIAFVDVSTPSPLPSTGTLEWETTLTWRPSSLSMGVPYEL